MAKIFDVMAAGGQYQSGGETKTRWIRCGAMFKNDETGRISIKLESLPVGTSNDDGEGGIWLSCFAPDRGDDKPAARRAPAPRRAPPPMDEAPDFVDDDIPF